MPRPEVGRHRLAQHNVHPELFPTDQSPALRSPQAATFRSSDSAGRFAFASEHRIRPADRRPLGESIRVYRVSLFRGNHSEESELRPLQKKRARSRQKVKPQPLPFSETAVRFDAGCMIHFPPYEGTTLACLSHCLGYAYAPCHRSSVGRAAVL